MCRIGLKDYDQKMYHEIEDARINNYKNYNPETDIIYSCDNMGLINYLYDVSYKNISDKAFEKKFITHRREVLDYFSDRDNFLELVIHENLNWDSLFAFLNKEIPSRIFLHAHTYKPSYIKWGLKYGKKFIPKPIREILKKHVFWKYID